MFERGRKSLAISKNTLLSVTMPGECSMMSSVSILRTSLLEISICNIKHC